MKKWVFVLLVVIIVMGISVACAGRDDPPVFEVGDEFSQGTGEKEASIGTDVYLFVDPADTSYMLFYVVDDYGNPIAGAQIYITYKGRTSLYGTTDASGKCYIYLFRGAEYQFTIRRSGYETVRGSFLLNEYSRTLKVIMRKINKTVIQILDGGLPAAGVKVIINGKTYTTDNEGKIYVQLPNGVFYARVILPDGRELTVALKVYGDTRLSCDIGQDDWYGAGSGFVYHERFLVYDRDYLPEDYYLTKYIYASEDVPLLDGETAEAHQARVEQYLRENINTVVIQAHPDKTQHDTHDEHILNPDGTPRHSQRSLMATGKLLRSFEEEGATHLIYTNEAFGLRFPLGTLHGETMTKAFALMEALFGGKSMKTIATPEAIKARNGLRDAGLTGLDEESLALSTIDWSALVAHGFDFEAQEVLPTLSGNVFDNTLFEFAITPIAPDALADMLAKRLTAVETMPWRVNEILLANKEYLHAELLRLAANGQLTDREQELFYGYIMDGKLDTAEMDAIAKAIEEGRLPEEIARLLKDAAMHGQVYRVQCYAIYQGVRVNITSCMEGLQVLTAADAAMAAPDLLGEWDTDPAGAMAPLAAQLMNGKPDENGPFYDVLTGKTFPRITVDVRRDATGAHATKEEDSITLPTEDRFYFVEDAAPAGVYVLAGDEEG